MTFVEDIKYMVAQCALKCTYKPLASKAGSLQNHLSSCSSSVVLCGPPVILRTCCGMLFGEHSGSCGVLSLCFHSFNCKKRSQKSVSTFPVQSSFTVTYPRESGRIVHPNRTGLAICCTEIVRKHPKSTTQ